MECVICFEALEEDTMTLQCRHTFHTQCIEHWSRTQRPSHCPLCRRPLCLTDGEEDSTEENTIEEEDSFRISWFGGIWFGGIVIRWIQEEWT